VSEYKLKSKSPLEGIQLKFKGIEIKENSSRAIVSLGISYVKKSEIAKTILSAFNVEIPSVGNSIVSTVNNTRFLGMQQDQLFLIFDYSGVDPLEDLPNQIKNIAYLTDQTDSWAMISLSGSNARSILQKSCPIDLHPINFGKDAVSRTIMEHLGVILVCESLNGFLVLSPWSTAQTFIKFIDNSIKSFCNENE